MSPYKLLQEQVDKDKHYPWRVIVSCALLNRTTGKQAHKAAGELFFFWPHPRSFAWGTSRHTSEREVLSDVLKPLGLVNRRTALLHAMTEDYLTGMNPHVCRGVGEYGRDALDLFCYGWTDLGGPVADHYLQDYLVWRRNGGPRIEWDEHGYDEWRISVQRGQRARPDDERGQVVPQGA